MDLTVIILTYNEENNLPQALASVKGWAKEVLVVDSFSSDRTCEIAKQGGARVVQNRFENYSAQRNFALQSGIQTEWIFFLDADEWPMPELKKEITALLATHPVANGFHVRFRLLWRGRWIKHGYYPTWLLRLARTAHVRCEARTVNEHLKVEGTTGRLKYDFYNENHNGIDRWHEKHFRYAQMEAQEMLRKPGEPPRLWGPGSKPKRWVQYRIWKKLPPYLRPWLYFFYRYVLRGGFLDGREALNYHLLQGLWFHTLISMKMEDLNQPH